MQQLLIPAMVAALVIPFPASAQSKPDFTGTWTLDEARSTQPQGRGGRGGGRGAGQGAGGSVVIKQGATDITIGPMTYKLDGSESVNPGRGGLEVKSRARWEGTRVVIESTREVQGFSIKTKEVRALGAGGKEMTVEVTATTPQGEQTFRLVYTKS